MSPGYGALCQIHATWQGKGRATRSSNWPIGQLMTLGPSIQQQQTVLGISEPVGQHQFCKAPD